MGGSQDWDGHWKIFQQGHLVIYSRRDHERGSELHGIVEKAQIRCTQILVAFWLEIDESVIDPGAPPVPLANLQM